MGKTTPIIQAPLSTYGTLSYSRLIDPQKRVIGEPYTVDVGMIKERAKIDDVTISQAKVRVAGGRLASQFVRRFSDLRRVEPQFIAPRPTDLSAGQSAFRTEAILGGKMIASARRGALEFAKSVARTQARPTIKPVLFAPMATSFSQAKVRVMIGRTTLQKQATRQAQRQALSGRVFTTTSFRMKTKAIPASKQLSKTLQVLRTRLGLLTPTLTKTITRQKVGIRTLQRQDVFSLFAFEPFRPYLPRPPKFLPPRTPKGIVFPFLNAEIFGEPRRKGKVWKPKFRYTPSLVASSERIFGRRPKMITGLEVRPIA